MAATTLRQDCVLCVNIALLRKYNLPIIADEIYAGCVFDGVFTSVSSVSEEVPVLVMGGA